MDVTRQEAFQILAALLAVLFCGSAAAQAPAETGEHLQSDEVRALVAEMIADADNRTNLLQSGSTGGHDGRFFISSPDGDFTLRPGGLIMFRYTYNHREDSDPDIDNDEMGFRMARARLWFGGAVFDTFNYFIRMQFSGRKPGRDLEDEEVNGIAIVDRAWVGFDLDDNWSLRLGQQVSELTRENEHSPDAILGVAASATDSVFGGGGFQGVQLHGRWDDYRVWFTFSDGLRTINTDFDNPDEADYAFSFKGDYKFAGEWSQFSKFTSFRGSDFGAMLGFGFHYEDGGEVGDPVADSLELLMAILEFSVEADGWNFYTAFYYAHDNFETNGKKDDFGFVAQGGYFVTENLEPYARFDAVIPDEDREMEDDEFRTITAGFNYYPFPGTIAAKFSFAALWFLDDERGSLVSPSTNVGVLESRDDDQFAIQAQFSLAF